VRAESIANQDFPKLFVEKGMVVAATRDCKPLVFHEILEKHVPRNIRDRVNCSPTNGGVGKFIRDKIKRERRKPREKTRKKKQRNGWRGWNYSFQLLSG